MGKWFGFCLALAGCAVSASAQKPLNVPAPPTERTGGPAPARGPLTFDVVVTDKAGHPIHGLQQSDFTVLDNKEPAPIRGFEAHEIASSPDEEALFIIMDDVNTDFDEISIERNQIEAYLRSDEGHLTVPVAIFILGDTGLEQITPVSSDGNQVASILHARDGQLRELRRSAGFWGAAERLDICMKAMDQFANYVGQARGRKLAIWISPGWPIFDNPDVIITRHEEDQIFKTVVGFSDELRRADVTLYSMDPHGPTDAASPRTFLWEDFTKPLIKPSQAQPGNLALQVMVTHTGGKVLLGSNDLIGEIRKCTQDALAWYTVSFDRQQSPAPDTWHTIQMKVDKPGVVVRTQNGYYSPPPAANAGQ